MPTNNRTKIEVNSILTGKLLRILRSSLAMNSKDFAEKMLGIPNCKLSRLEHGTIEPDVCILKAYSEIFKWPMDKLVVFKGEEDKINLTLQMAAKILINEGIDINSLD